MLLDNLIIIIGSGKLDMESSIGKMARYTKGNGRMENSMEKEKFMMQTEINKQGNGLMGRKFE